MRKIIAFCGLIGSGKDTAAEYLVNNHGYVRDSFAASLKDTVSAVFGWDRELIDGTTPTSRQWREQVDTWWANRLDIPTLTPRRVLQHWGTDVLRNNFHEDIWIASLESRLEKTTDNRVITDVRFANEIHALRNVGAAIVQIKRGPEPDWFTLAVRANNGDLSCEQILQDRGIHASERSWAGYPMNAIIENNSTIQDFYNEISVLLENLESNPPAAKANLAREAAVGNWHKLS
jgi:hypothetical protein